MAARKTLASLSRQIAKLQRQLKRLSAAKKKLTKKVSKKKPRKVALKKRPKKVIKKKKVVKKKKVTKKVTKKKIVKKRITKRKISSLSKKPTKKARKKDFKQGEKIRKSLIDNYAIKLCETVQIQLEDLAECHWRSYQYANSSVDVEIRISFDNLDSETIQDKLLDIEDIIGFQWPKDFYYTIGIQVDDDNVTGSPTLDRRPHRAWLYPTHDLSSAILRLRVGLIAKIAEWLTAKGRITDLIIRIHWNPWNIQPKRPRR